MTENPFKDLKDMSVSFTVKHPENSDLLDIYLYKFPDAPGFEGKDPDKWYLAWCVDCAGGEIPFRLADKRDEWANRHTEATGHKVRVFDAKRGEDQ